MYIGLDLRGLDAPRTFFACECQNKSGTAHGSWIFPSQGFRSTVMTYIGGEKVWTDRPGWRDIYTIPSPEGKRFSRQIIVLTRDLA